ncbi:MAG: hypothetical protein NTV32_00695 [Gammaproteobacteria bacterium]|jgi:hypothetical protein|nr:hypothetical protein [Gammaproteobacteria bacterium]
MSAKQEFLNSMIEALNSSDTLLQKIGALGLGRLAHEGESEAVKQSGAIEKLLHLNQSSSDPDVQVAAAYPLMHFAQAVLELQASSATTFRSMSAVESLSQPVLRV